MKKPLTNVRPPNKLLIRMVKCRENYFIPKIIPFQKSTMPSQGSHDIALAASKSLQLNSNGFGSTQKSKTSCQFCGQTFSYLDK